MKKVKFAIALFFIAVALAALAKQASGYPAFLIKARKFGAKDCTFCHVDPEGGPPFNARGQWLIREKQRRDAETINPEWLADYKPGTTTDEKSNDKPPAQSADHQEKMSGGKQAASHDAGPVERELVELFNEMVEAARQRDLTALNRFFADDFSETNSEGAVFSKAQALAIIPQMTIESYTVNDVAIRIYGDAAVITFQPSIKGSYQGRAISGDFRETMFWVKREGRWQVVAAHASRIANK